MPKGPRKYTEEWLGLPQLVLSVREDVRTGLGVFSSQHGVQARSIHIFSKFQDNDHAVVSASMGKARGHGRTGWMTD